MSNELPHTEPADGFYCQHGNRYGRCPAECAPISADCDCGNCPDCVRALWGSPEGRAVLDSISSGTRRIGGDNYDH